MRGHQSPGAGVPGVGRRQQWGGSHCCEACGFGSQAHSCLSTAPKWSLVWQGRQSGAAHRGREWAEEVDLLRLCPRRSVCWVCIANFSTYWSTNEFVVHELYGSILLGFCATRIYVLVMQCTFQILQMTMFHSVHGRESLFLLAVFKGIASWVSSLNHSTSLKLIENQGLKICHLSGTTTPIYS